MDTPPREFEIRPTDQFFGDSPNAGDPACRCSRCGQVIAVTAVRLWDDVTSGAGSGGMPKGEYRFHPECLGLLVDQAPQGKYAR